MRNAARVPAAHFRLNPVERRQLYPRVVALIPSSSILPPPIAIRLQVHRESQCDLELAVATNAQPLPEAANVEFCEVTGCLDPDSRRNGAVDVGSFRDWAISAPEHPLAVRYQPLLAWLQGARIDPRFLELAEQFVCSERMRLRAELVGAAERLLGRLLPRAQRRP